jgi:hypothetical protein
MSSRRQLYLDLAERHGAKRPVNRNECRDGERPCPWWSCRYHLGSDISDKGEIVTYPAVESDGMPTVEIEPSCSLDLADQGVTTLDGISRIMGGLSLEAVRQVELRAIAKLQAYANWHALKKDD